MDIIKKKRCGLEYKSGLKMIITKEKIVNMKKVIEVHIENRTEV